jgi:hypothetical protein
MERLNLKKLSDVEGKQKYGVVILNRLIVLESVDDNVNISRAWKSTGENNKISAKES